jgi:hypothetical protein
MGHNKWCNKQRWCIRADLTPCYACKKAYGAALKKRSTQAASTNNASHVIRCKVVGGAWDGKFGTIIGTVPNNGAFRVQIDKDICAAFFGSELQAVA